MIAIGCKALFVEKSSDKFSGQSKKRLPLAVGIRVTSRPGHAQVTGFGYMNMEEQFQAEDIISKIQKHRTRPKFVGYPLFSLGWRIVIEKGIDWNVSLESELGGS